MSPSLLAVQIVHADVTRRAASHRARVGAHAGAVVAVAVSDLDGLAALNEAHGAEATTRVLTGWQRTLSSSVPDDAVVARISGDEWAVAMPGASAESALIILEEIRAHYTERGIPGVDSTLGVSIGIAARPPHAASIEGATRAAVEALMRAKRPAQRVSNGDTGGAARRRERASRCCAHCAEGSAASWSLRQRSTTGHAKECGSGTAPHRLPRPDSR